MAIDPIGKKPGISTPEAPEAPGAGGVSGSSFAETLDRTREASKVSEPGAATTPLARLQAGQISVDQYIDAKLDEAMSSVQGLDADQKLTLREDLRARMTEESHLSDLMQWVRPSGDAG